MKKLFVIIILIANVSRADTLNFAWDPVTQDFSGNSIKELQGYKLYVSSSPIAAGWPIAGLTPVATVAADTTSKQLINDTVGKYYAVVTAFNSAGESEPSNEVSFEIKIKPPKAPTRLRVAN